MPAQTKRWVNQAQPQTLVIATFLLYAEAVFRGLDLLRFGPRVAAAPMLLIYLVVPVVGGVFSGRSIANERRIGWYTGLATAAFPFLWRIPLQGNPFQVDIVTLIFEVALVALLVHPQSREYQRIWFK